MNLEHDRPIRTQEEILDRFYDELARCYLCQVSPA